ncbi:hypothetical protein GUJ93_ZPchr0014g46595 [Zizania palustris]|uniref:Uncharacterized protein n=1 Tax=Zizania palustris TaxID=103762 RepID=A0A8J5T8K8_ZIZPA|nr:hypothetical protein GUJ93_ZPchr0014g46595 [Zizania palustris]
MNLPHPLAFDAALVSTAVADAELDRANAVPSSSSTPLPVPDVAFRNDAHPKTLDLRLSSPTLPPAPQPPPVETDRERSIRRSRSMRLYTLATALPDAEEEDEGEYDDAQGQGCVRAHSGQSRRRRSRRQYGHTPPQDKAGCFRQRRSSPSIPVGYPVRTVALLALVVFRGSGAAE